MSAPEDKNSDQDYLDVSDEFESDIDNLDNDFSEESDDGIFAPDEAKEKKSKSGSKFKVIILVVLIAFLAGGGFFLYSSQDVPPVMPAAPVPPPAQAQQESLPGIPKPASDFTNADPQTPVSAPAPVVNSPGNSGVTLNQDASNAPAMPQLPVGPDEGTSVTPAGSNTDSSPPHISEKNISEQTTSSTAVQGDIARANESQMLPSTGQQPVAETDNSPVSKHKVLQSAEKAAPQVPDDPAKVETPDPSVLAPVSASPKKEAEKTLSKEMAKEPTEENVPAPKKDKKSVADNFYFDAPKGKALTDIPPPSIDPMRTPGESIIIVRKPGQKEIMPKAAPSRDGSVVVEKGEDNQMIELKLVNANRASGLGMNDSALGFYNELYRKNPSDPRILMGRAVTLQKLGETQKAIDAYREVLDIDPGNEEATTNLMGLIGKTQPAVALENLLEMHLKYPKSAVVSAQLGIAYAQAGNPQDGLKYLNMAASQDPKNPLHYYNMAVISEHMKDRVGAIQYYEKALDTYSIYGDEAKVEFSREEVYDRLAKLRGN